MARRRQFVKNLLIGSGLGLSSFSFFSSQKTSFSSLSIVYSNAKNIKKPSELAEAINAVPYLKRVKALKGKYLSSGDLLSSELTDLYGLRLVSHNWKSKEAYKRYLEEVNVDRLKQALGEHDIHLKITKSLT